jgi:hypothetical protein
MAKKGLDLSKKYGVADMLASAGHPNAASLLKKVGGGRIRPHYRYRKQSSGMVHSIHVPMGHYWSKKHKSLRKYKR